MGMGQLFKEYGRPSMLGVGHVRQALNSEAEAGSTDLTGGAEGICNAREHGGQANANGLGKVNCESTSEGQVQADQDQQPGAGGQGNGQGGGNGGGNGGGQGGGNGGGNGSGGGNGGGNGDGGGKGGRP
jgi:hypothetical protein